MTITLSALQKQRRDNAANWTAENPTLLAGEIGLESDTGYWKVGDGSTAWTSLAYITGLGAEIPVSRLADGTARQLLQTAANGTNVEWTSNVDIPGTLDVTGAATFDNNVIIQGDLTVNGTETIINTQTLDVEDKNIVIGKVVAPSDVTADGGGITLKGTTDKTINWIDATDAWTLSEHVNIASTKEYRIAGTKVLDATSLGSAVVSSSLTSVGTIGTGIWQGTTVATGYGGTGQTTYSNGQLLIGKTDGTLAKATITQGTGITITNGDGSITISATGSGGTVTGVTGTAPITSSGGTAPNIDLSLKTNGGLVTETGTLAVDLGASSITGTLGVADGGTGQTTYTDGQLLIGNSTGNTLSKSTLTAGTGITITNGSGSISVNGTAASTSTAGVVQLEDSTSSTSTTTAATPNSVKTAYDLANAALPKAGGTVSGNLNVTGNLTVDTNTLFVDATNNRVGVGTTSPGNLLDLGGQTSPKIGINSSGTGTPGILFQGTGTTYGSINQNIFSGELAIKAGSAGQSAHFITFGTNDGTERARIDSSGRLLVGTSSPYITETHGYDPLVQVASVYQTKSVISLINAGDNTYGPTLAFVKRRNNINGSYVNYPVLPGDSVGNITFYAENGEYPRPTASIKAVAEGNYTIPVASMVVMQDYYIASVGTTDFTLYGAGSNTPGTLFTCMVFGPYSGTGTVIQVNPAVSYPSSRLVFSTANYGSEVEQMRITYDGVLCYKQNAGIRSAAATLAVSELKTGITQYTGAAATLTLPTGTLMEGGFFGAYTNMTFEWSVINTGTGTCTIGASTGHTIVGAATVTAGASGRFASRRSAANTFVTYRLS